MSAAFVKEGDAQWLHDISPTMTALVAYLTGENNGVRVYERSNHFSDKEQREVFEMSNGLSYAVNDENQWYIVW